MANPRQRSKKRSSSYKPVGNKRTKKMLKKQPPIRGPKILQDSWDKHKTVQQNYAALGLVASLNPSASGGSERELHPPQPSLATITDPAPQEAQPTKIPHGYGKIIRDKEGNVIDIELAESEGETMEEDRDQDIGELNRGPIDDSLMNWIQLGHGPPESGSVIEELERISEGGISRKPRPVSTGEKAYLQRLIARHGNDLEAMARDQKLNPDQRSAGQLGRALRTANLIVTT